MVLKTMTPEVLHKKLQSKEDVLLLDVRAEEKYNDFHIIDPSIESLNINKTEILEETAAVNTIPKDREIIVTCTTGNSATKCATILADNNYNVVVLEGGITAWKEYIENK